MKMTSMKLPKVKKDKNPALTMSSEGDQYPWGMRITLNEDQIKNMEHMMGYKPGDNMDMVAKVSVVSVKSEQLKGGKKDRRVELQITHFGCDEPDSNGDAGKSDAEWAKSRKKA